MRTKAWSDEQLAQLTVQHGFRLRGAQMTRLETFTDAAFAFAVTLLVILVDDVPRTYEEFMAALESVPVFVICFCQLMIFWWGHHIWSRRYGLEEGWDIILSLALVATVLFYVYPLRVIFSAFIWNLRGDSVEEQFVINLPQLGNMFLVFGIGFTLLAGLIVAHFLRAHYLRRELKLNALERLLTWDAIYSWSIVAATGLTSAVLAVLLPDDLKPAAAYAYYTLAVTLPTTAAITKRKKRALR